MTTLSIYGATVPTRTSIHDTIAEHGALRVLFSALRAMLVVRRFRRERPPDVSKLDARMRRDIGLLPELDVTDLRIMFR